MNPCKLSKATLFPTLNDQAISSSRREKDHISRLPDELIYTIFSYLNLRDAVKTSVLSHRWKHVCSSLPKLQFNRNIIKPEFRDCKNPCVLYKEKFVGAVNQFLQFYRGSQFSSFAIQCCLGREWTNDIDGWVRFALGRGTKKLTLHFYCNKFCSSSDKDKNSRGVKGKYILKSDLFDGLETSNLKHLSLVACNLGENFTCQFTCLESLVIDDSPSSLYHLNSMFSSLSKLKILIFVRCILPKKLFLNLLPLLERLEVCSSNGLEEIEFLNVNLVTFVCLCAKKTILFDLRGVPNLKQFSYAVPSSRLRHFFTHVAEHIPKLTSLRIFNNYNWVKFMPETLSVFSQVTTLFLVFLDEEFYALKIISILRAFPHLCTLGLVTKCEKDFGEEMAKACEYVPKHLKMVELRGFRSTPNQMEFAIYLLKNASALKQLVIRSEVPFPPGPGEQPWDKRELLVVTQRLEKFAKDKVQLIIG